MVRAGTKLLDWRRILRLYSGQDQVASSQASSSAARSQSVSDVPDGDGGCIHEGKLKQIIAEMLSCWIYEPSIICAPASHNQQPTPATRDVDQVAGTLTAPATPNPGFRSMGIEDCER